MNLIKILNKLADPNVVKAQISRRNSLKGLGITGKELALASIPFGLAATGSKTSAATMAMPSAALQASPIEVLKFALTLEYLERNFYQMGMDTDGLIPAEDRDVFGLLLEHEASHVAFLSAALGEEAIEEPEFDFTGGTLNLDTFDNYQTFLALSQGFEDTGVRAYKGQAGALIDDNALLEYALQIHSIEARHASQIRRMRGEKGWITRDNSTLPGAFSAIYAGEANTVQLGVQLAGKFEDFGGVDAITEAFDEPLTMEEVLAIASIFLAPNN